MAIYISQTNKWVKLVPNTLRIIYYTNKSNKNSLTSKITFLILVLMSKHFKANETFLNLIVFDRQTLTRF